MYFTPQREIISLLSPVTLLCTLKAPEGGFCTENIQRVFCGWMALNRGFYVERLHIYILPTKRSMHVGRQKHYSGVLQRVFNACRA